MAADDKGIKNTEESNQREFQGLLDIWAVLARMDTRAESATQALERIADALELANRIALHAAEIQGSTFEQGGPSWIEQQRDRLRQECPEP